MHALARKVDAHNHIRNGVSRCGEDGEKDNKDAIPPHDASLVVYSLVGALPSASQVPSHQADMRGNGQEICFRTRLARKCSAVKFEKNVSR